jgi:hypothetical protein
MATLAGGQRLTAALLNSVLGVLVSDTQDTTGGRTATTYSATLSAGTACGVAFIAPASGSVIVHNMALLENSGTGRSHCSVRIGTGGTIGGGTPFLAAADENGIAMQSGDATDDATLSKPIVVSGLTPGATYNAQQQFRATAGTVTTSWRRLAVQPVV